MADRREYNRAWRAAHKAEIKAYNAAYVAAHREQVAEAKRIYERDHRETIRERHRAYHQAHRAEIAEKSKAYRAEHRAEHTANARRHAERYPAKIYARATASQAARRGYVDRPNACSKCGRACKPEGHHDDYSRPLDVRWLCRPCHLDFHRDRELLADRMEQQEYEREARAAQLGYR